VGRAEEIQVAQPHQRMVDHKALGMAGTAEFWAGVEKLEAKIKWASLYSAVLVAAASPFVSHSFQVRGSLAQYTSQGRSAELPVVYLMTGVFKDAGAFNFKQHESVDTTSAITVYHSELFVAGAQIHLYDVMSNIYVCMSSEPFGQIER
jgi:P2 family phage contractile tail tube protein